MRMTSAPGPLLSRRRALAWCAGGLVLPSGACAATYREIGWMDLMPRDWDPTRGLRELPAGLDDLQDTDPQARALLDKLRQAWDNAPVVPAMAGAQIKLPGYVVPLEATPAGLHEFLLVPYFGACIHSPPPPANQILLCRAAQPIPDLRSMDAVWASGRLRIERSASEMGTVAYALQVASVDKQ